MAKAKYKYNEKRKEWTTKVWDGTYTPDGRKHRKNLSSKKSSADLEKQVNALRVKIESGTQTVKGDTLFLDYAEYWFRTYKAIREDATKQMYRNVIENHLDFFEDIQIKDVKKAHIQALINENSEKYRTCQIIKLTWNQIIKTAASERLLPATAILDLCSGISMPKPKASEKRPLSDIEKEAIMKAELSPRQRAYLYLIYGCGLRRQEALALRREDIDLKNNLVHVKIALGLSTKMPSIKSTKTVNSVRSVPMPAFLSAFLKDYIPVLEGSYVIPGIDGGPLSKSKFDNMWRSIRAKINRAAGGTDKINVIDGLSSHTFRHNYCTELCYQVPSISIKKIAQLLGDSEKMVTEVYSHIMDNKEDTDGAIERIFGK